MLGDSSLERNALKEGRSVYRGWAAARPLCRVQPTRHWEAPGAVEVSADHFQGPTRDGHCRVLFFQESFVVITTHSISSITDNMDLNDEDGPPELVDANEVAAIAEKEDNIKVPLTLVTGI